MTGPITGAAKGRRRRAASRGELELWHAAMRDARPLRHRPPRPAAPDPVAVAEPASEAPLPPRARRKTVVAPAPIALPALADRNAPGLDRASAERLKRGKYAIDDRLDLHGMTQEVAHRALESFILAATRRGLRCVIVITGKGLRGIAEGAADLGILRNAVPRWLNESNLRGKILAFTTAQPRDGGGGALYVLLRRAR
ncbi:MAG: mismatch repair protein MutS [Rhodospirillales bacterium]|nr:mismatch repair protein MutS [Rhodospirillales bacterium]